jgi:predicted dehydrogenase
MGPYYITALVSLLGPVASVTGSARMSFPERTISSDPKKGTKIKVEVPTHVVGVLEFASGAIATLMTSFDVWAARLPRIEVYGEKGSLSVPDPNGFKGPVSLFEAGAKEWKEMPLTHAYLENSRGIGVADMAVAIRENRPHRANGDLAFHVLEIMHGIHESAAGKRSYKLNSTCKRPEPFPTGANPL